MTDINKVAINLTIYSFSKYWNHVQKIFQISSHFDTVELMDYLRLVGTLGEVTSYNEFFPIFTLIALLSGEGLSQGGQFSIIFLIISIFIDNFFFN